MRLDVLADADEVAGKAAALIAAVCRDAVRARGPFAAAAGQPEIPSTRR